MHEVIPKLLWLGHASDGRDAKGLFASDIQAVVDLAAEERAAQLPREFVYCRFPLVDGDGNSPAVLEMAVTTVASFLEKQVRTLVCCGAGMSRSPAVAAFAVALNSGRPPDECLGELIAGQPHDMSSALWHELRTACIQNGPDSP